MKVGDLVRWKADNGIGTILRVEVSDSGRTYLDIHWQTGLPTGIIAADHSQLGVVLLSDHKKDSSC